MTVTNTDKLVTANANSWVGSLSILWCLWKNRKPRDNDINHSMALPWSNAKSDPIQDMRDAFKEHFG